MKLFNSVHRFFFIPKDHQNYDLRIFFIKHIKISLLERKILHIKFIQF